MNDHKSELQPYQRRLIDEITELVDRINKLESMLIKYRTNALDFTPTCSYELLNAQYVAMLNYLGILRQRADIEGLTEHTSA